MIEVKAYRCEHCVAAGHTGGAVFTTVKSVADHEAKCELNPAIKGCWTCTHRVIDRCAMGIQTLVCKGSQPHGRHIEVDPDDPGVWTPEYEPKRGCPKWVRKGATPSS